MGAQAEIALHSLSLILLLVWWLIFKCQLIFLALMYFLVGGKQVYIITSGKICSCPSHIFLAFCHISYMYRHEAWQTAHSSGLPSILWHSE